MNNKSFFKEIILTEPVKKGERTVEKLTFASPRVRHLKAMDEKKGDVAKSLALASALTGEPVAVLDELTAEDFAICSKVLEEIAGKFTITEKPKD